MNIFSNFFSRHRVPAHVHFTSLTGLDYNLILNGIYVGTNQCCTAGLSDVLKKESITSDISLEENRLDMPFGVETYTWIPTKDHSYPTKDQIDFGIATLEQLVSKNKKVYIHCKNGHGRSSTLLSAYLMKTKGMTQEEALIFIQSKRPGAHMQQGQIDFLKSLKFA